MSQKQGHGAPEGGGCMGEKQLQKQEQRQQQEQEQKQRQKQLQILRYAQDDTQSGRKMERPESLGPGPVLLIEISLAKAPIMFAKFVKNILLIAKRLQTIFDPGA